MKKELFDQIVAVLQPEMGDANARRALIEIALYGSTALQKIQWDGAEREFTVRIVRLLDQFGEVESGRLAIVALLEEVKAQVGSDRQAKIDQLLAQLNAQTVPQDIPSPLTASSAQPGIQPPSTTNEAGEFEVFLSFAGADRAVAEKVEAFLTEAGVRVFYDQKSIPPGADWNQAISQALKECLSMVLLLSSSSMPSDKRKEVYDEWFPFDQMGKTIYPLLITDCELDRRFVARNYIDARSDLQSALDRLLKELLPNAASRAARKPTALAEFHLARIAEWEHKKYALDERFINLTLMLGEAEDEQKPEDLLFDNLHEVLDITQTQHTRVLLGAPGCGKSTLLRRLQYDHSKERLQDGADELSFFIQLNGYRMNTKGQLPEPREWLNTRWALLYPQLPPLETWLQKGRVLLLLDALNEMPHKNTGNYFELVELWREFSQEASSLGNQLVFTCRRQDYSAALQAPVIEILPMKPEQVQLFLKVYLPQNGEQVWTELKESPFLLELYQRPYFLKLLCEQIELAGGGIPKGRVGLFTRFVRKALSEETEKNNEFLRNGQLLDVKDHLLLTGAYKYAGPFDLPERGVLIPKLSELAFKMQEKGKQVRLNDYDASAMLAHECAEAILKVGLSLNVLDEDSAGIAFFHQLLQEYFAARWFARQPNPNLVHVEWAADKVRPTLVETKAGLGNDDWMPPLENTGWEETTLTAAPMAKDTEAFIRELIPHNLPLAARCAAAPEVKINSDLKSALQTLLLSCMQDQQADLRARIRAGEALGVLGDPRFEYRTGSHGACLLPPLVEIAGGMYPMGIDEKELNIDDTPAHTVELINFQIGRFPITNAEYSLFLEAGGYEQEQWWDNADALKWLRKTEDRQPKYWNDKRFNNPSQPVVGITWFEARAYCNWLTLNVANERIYRLPTEAEFEIAARGTPGRMFPYGDIFDESRCNIRESHIGRTTPVGIFDNATPEAIFDLIGNVFTWTLSIYDQRKFQYPYQGADGREDTNTPRVNRVLRGSSWFSLQEGTRSSFRYFNKPGRRSFSIGFRVVSVPSLLTSS